MNNIEDTYNQQPQQMGQEMRQSAKTRICKKIAPQERRKRAVVGLWIIDYRKSNIDYGKEVRF